MTELKVGVVTHYYEEIGIAIIDLSGPLHQGDRIRISGSKEFAQIVDTIQMEHELLPEAFAGDTVGLKVVQPVIPGDEIIVRLGI